MMFFLNTWILKHRKLHNTLIPLLDHAKGGRAQNEHLPSDDVTRESTCPDLEVAITSEGCEQMYPRLEGVLVNGEPEGDAAWFGTP